jgi:hypothetical protein
MATDEVVATIENKPGQAGSLALYNHLRRPTAPSRRSGARRPRALRRAHEDARANPGKHPNIDRLDLMALTLRVKQGSLRVKHVFFASPNRP